MSKKFGRFMPHVAALGLAAGLVVAAGASQFPQLVISCPTEIVAGNPINGYATGNLGVTVVNGFTFGSGPLGPTVVGVSDPLNFSYPTFEYQAPGIATITARDDDESAVASVVLK